MIHFPTNKITAPQIASWSLGAILLAVVYMVSGSIWIAIGVHFITDFTNVVVFNVAGQGSIFRFSEP